MRCIDCRSVAVIGRAESGDAARAATEAAARSGILFMTQA
jgi:hypothetical protein